MIIVKVNTVYDGDVFTIDQIKNDKPFIVVDDNKKPLTELKQSSGYCGPRTKPWIYVKQGKHIIACSESAGFYVTKTKHFVKSLKLCYVHTNLELGH